MNEKIQDHWLYVFAKNNTRYFAVAGVFVLAILYNQAFPEVKEIKKNKNVSYQSQWKRSDSDLDAKSPEKVYARLFNSVQGDFYRLGFYARADKDEKIFVKIKSLSGQEKEISAVEMKGRMEEEQENAPKYFEIVFPTDSNYGDVVFSREKMEPERVSAEWEETGNNDEKTEKEMIWEDNKIFLSDVFVSRLDVKNETETRSLKPTILGEVRTEKTHLPDKNA